MAMMKRMFMEGSGSPKKMSKKHEALETAFRKQVGDALLTGKAGKGPKTVAEGEFEVMSKKPKSFRRHLKNLY